MSIASISTTSTATPKKTRRFSIVRLFSNSNNSSNGSPSLLSASSSSTTLNDATPYRHSMDPKSSSSSSMDTMQTEIMRERRKSIAALTLNSSPRCSMSLDFRPASARRPILGGRKESAVPQAEMNEKMREFDELLQTRKTSTIRISLTPSLVQDTY
ncbi:hypothetical protein BGZ97_012970 [Linnemannia gamsii]|uniref:Uncharacterized protein n=1 Tax=Linnemannia gamsii TaxID=64522 RepID=A0A9P6UL50_9FUNG|nr:hypothetical protein BGZ97_012970 [Linnemannia gamsii]